MDNKILIPVTVPFLPDKEVLFSHFNKIYDRNWLTNHGPFVIKLEKELKDYLKHDQLKFVSNGTIALQVALQAIGKRGEVITTAFSYVATSSSIVWEGNTPIFVDIDEKTLNIDPLKIEAKLTSNTIAILATHVYGNPCDIEALESISKKHNVPVIYDGAHCFGTTYKNRSVFHFGSLSIASFHATKIFHTVEGGAVFSNESKYNKKIIGLMNFGHAAENEFDMIGINGKNSEFHAAMGLAILPSFQEILETRKHQWLNYFDSLINEQTGLCTFERNENAELNYAYFPIISESVDLITDIENALNEIGVKPRRYFSPALNALEIFFKDGIKQDCPIAESISTRVLCLPLYHTLSTKDQNSIIELILTVTKEYGTK